MITKRIFDLIISILGIVLLLPVFLIIAVVIFFSSKSKIFFLQDRVGYKGSVFKIYKFRTMVDNAENIGAKLTSAKDPRITKFGIFLRNYKLDELPQLLNVVKGDMSIVGPRPEVKIFVDLYSDIDRLEILSVKPGITDDSSIYFKNESELLLDSKNPEDFYSKNILPKKILFYKKYVKTYSLLGDIKIIFKSLKAILKD